jgi:hypothetical protein
LPKTTIKIDEQPEQPLFLVEVVESNN